MSQDSARTELMGKLQRVCQNTQAAHIYAELNSLGEAPAPTLPSSDLCEAFLINVLKNQGTVACAGNRSEAVKAVAEHLHSRFRTRKLVAGNDPRLAAMPWRDGAVLPRFGAAEHGENASLSYARMGIAETGSIVTYTGKSNPAANNLLVEDHIVLVDTATLVATLDDAWIEINKNQEKSGRPRGINFISGPSSTADIEAQLVKGAHGPRSWHVILLGEVPEGALDNAQNALEAPLNSL
ncbi:MAG: L-lactate dehydrogenase complex protein LldG [Halioglobus sp.]|jgi:L-lactate dehydrogenase complex protein LldG